ncbi:hypothetical protein OH77DRAFT_1432310 [Trametes cingulata]|nr:hypothetical protein OH77DRAFT_1432310 [Trametes cingulata]
MQSERFSSADDRAEYIAWALSGVDGYPFRYERVSDPALDGKITKTGIYQSKIIARTFAYHLRRIGLRADQVRDCPCNALALATTAVERALKMWESGSLRHPKPRSEEAKFSERLWGKTANEYLGGMTNLEERQWDSILAKAELCARGLDEDSDDDVEDEVSSNPDIPMTGGRTTIDDDEQAAHEAAVRGVPAGSETGARTIPAAEP